MDNSLFMAVGPSERPATVLAALGPKMLSLSADRADGAHPYFVPVEHTAQAREIVGPDAILAPEQMVVLDTDRARALEIARKGMAVYLRAPNYVNNLKRLGFTDDDVADGGSERLVDAIVACGDVERRGRTGPRPLRRGRIARVACRYCRTTSRPFPDGAWKDLAAGLAESRLTCTWRVSRSRTRSTAGDRPALRLLLDRVQECSLDLGHDLDLDDLGARPVPNVERIDDVRAERLDLGRPDVEVEIAQGLGDPVQHADRVRRFDVDHGCVVGRSVVERDPRAFRRRQPALASVRSRPIGEASLDGQPAVQGAVEVRDDVGPWRLVAHVDR